MIDIIPCILLNLIDFRRSEDDFLWLQPLRLLKDFPECEENGEDSYHEVGE